MNKATKITRRQAGGEGYCHVAELVATGASGLPNFRRRDCHVAQSVATGAVVIMCTPWVEGEVWLALATWIAYESTAPLGTNGGGLTRLLPSLPVRRRLT